MKKVLLTSVCGPLGVRHGDSPSVGYELLHEQVTRAQGLFSPRSHHIHFSLEYIAENLDAQTTVLQYPTKDVLIRELKNGYDFVGVSFVLATFHRMVELVALVRKHAPQAKIVLGGYGTVASDELLRPHGDHICREEGVAFMRDLLGEPEIPMPYRHPMIINPLLIFGRKVSQTGIVLAGLGCPNGCDFCCTSHFFKRKHIRLLPTGADIHRIVERYLDVDPEISILVLDEDFLLNRKRAMEFRDCVLRAGKPLSIFVFASIRAISQYTVTEILEMGIDGMWIGYEGTRSGYAKQQGRPAEEVLREFRDHGITVLASMIVGFPYQTPEIIDQELAQLLEARPTLTQFLIYGPCPGTPFYEQVMREGLLEPELAADHRLFYRRGTGFHSVVRHPTMSGAEIEAAQTRCFRTDFERLGPAIHRSVDTWFRGYLALRGSASAFLRAKAARFAQDIRHAWPIFLTGKLFGPNAQVRRDIARLEKEIVRVLGRPTLRGRVESLAAVALATLTSVRLRLGLFQHPKPVRHAFRTPDPKLARAWSRKEGAPSEHRIEMEHRPPSTLWVRVEGMLGTAGATQLVERVGRVLRSKKRRAVLDLGKLSGLDGGAPHRIAEGLAAYRDRIRLVMPSGEDMAALMLLGATFKLY